MSQSPAPSPSTSGLGCGTRREDAVPNDEHMSSKAKAGAADHLYWSKEKSNKPPPPLTAADAKAAKRENAVVSDKVWTPIFKWGQRKDKVVLTIFVPCLEEEAVQVDVKPKTLEFKADRVAAFAGDKKEQRVYTLSLKLCAEVDDSRAEIFIRHDHVRVELPKVSAKPWRTLQQAGIPKHPNERPDFDFVDGSDDEDDEVLCRPVPSGADRKRGGGGRSSGGGWLAYLRATSLIGAWEMPLFLVALGYVVLAPLTKVEESFGLQATHDLLFHQADLESYDHLEFPGVVPRSFLGPIFLALVSSPLVGGLGLAGQDKFASQYAVRGSLACASCACLTFLLRKVKAQYGRDTYRALVFVSLSQFHWLFYCSRTLPNTFASLLVTLATGFWVDGKVVPCLRLLTAAVVIFRSELVLLLGPLSLLFLYNRQIALPTLVWTGLSAACLSLLLTCTVDSIFWGRTLYPEGEVLWFNTILNKSKEYGTSPFHWYFTSALPRALLGAYPLALLSLQTVKRARPRSHPDALRLPLLGAPAQGAPLCALCRAAAQRRRRRRHRQGVRQPALAQGQPLVCAPTDRARRLHDPRHPAADLVRRLRPLRRRRLRQLPGGARAGGHTPTRRPDGRRARLAPHTRPHRSRCGHERRLALPRALLRSLPILKEGGPQGARVLQVYLRAGGAR